jgi:hypothetical protein
VATGTYGRVAEVGGSHDKNRHARTDERGAETRVAMITCRSTRTLHFSIPQSKKLFALLIVILKQLLEARPVNAPP